jgi:hypothetical protein
MSESKPVSQVLPTVAPPLPPRLITLISALLLVVVLLIPMTIWGLYKSGIVTAGPKMTAIFKFFGDESFSAK